MKLDNLVSFGRPLSGKVIIQVMTEFEPRHEISINVVCATSNVHMLSRIRPFACRSNILRLLERPPK